MARALSSAKWILLLLVLSLVLLPISASAGVPGTMTYQGVLTDAQGNPVNGQRQITFSIYNTPSGGTPLWSESLNVQIDDGLFTALLGKSTPLTPGLVNGSPLYLGVKVGADVEMGPRQELTSVLSAIKSSSLQTETTGGGKLNIDGGGIKFTDAQNATVTEFTYDGRSNVRTLTAHSLDITQTAGITTPVLGVPTSGGGRAILDQQGLRFTDFQNVTVTEYTYDGLGRVRSMTARSYQLPTSGGGRAILDTNGLRFYDSAERVVGEYDRLGNVVSQVVRTFTAEVPTVGGGRAILDQQGLRFSDSQNATVTEYSYDGRANVRTLTAHSLDITQTAGVITPALRVPTSGGGRMTIDLRGVRFADINGVVVTEYTYDGLGRVRTMTARSFDLPTSGGGRAILDQQGIRFTDSQNATVSEFTYDGRGKVSTLTANSLDVTQTAGVTTPVLSVPTSGGGRIILDTKGLGIYDSQDHRISEFDQSGGLFAQQVLTHFLQTTTSSSGTATIDANGFTVYDDFGAVIGRFNHNGGVISRNVTTSEVIIQSGGQSVAGIDPFGDIQARAVTAGTVTAQSAFFDGVFATKGTFGALDPLVLESFAVSQSESYTPGDVVVIDPAGSGGAVLSNTADDTGVLGVVAPAAVVDANVEILVIILGAHGPIMSDGTRLTAYVRADASYGAIRPGDLLTTSPTTGHAMRASDPKLGSILGKALEPLGDGQGLIKIFVTLS